LEIRDAKLARLRRTGLSSVRNFRIPQSRSEQNVANATLGQVCDVDQQPMTRARLLQLDVPSDGLLQSWICVTEASHARDT
jgi:hypothetical protein